MLSLFNGRLVLRLGATIRVMIFVTLSFLAACMFLGAGIEQNELYLKGRCGVCITPQAFF